MTTLSAIHWLSGHWEASCVLFGPDYNRTSALLFGATEAGWRSVKRELRHYKRLLETLPVTVTAISRGELAAPTRNARIGLRKAMRRRSAIAVLMTLPLILLVGILVVYPTLYSLYLATLNKSMERFIGFGNFLFLFKRETFWLVAKQSCIFAVTAVAFKVAIGFFVAHFVDIIPAKGRRKWHGILLVPWVIPPAMSCLTWLWLFEPSFSAFNWALARFGVGPVPWTGTDYWARFSVILVNIWIGAPFFMTMYLAALKSVPEELYQAAAIDGAGFWQRMWFITLPMMRHIILITALFSLIGTLANYAIVGIITAGGPLDKTHIFGTWAFQVGIEGGDIPLGATVSLFMVPILAIAAIFILRGVTRANDA
jgi:multiple sugar transport system permease protein